MAKVLEEAKVKISKKKARELSITLETRIVSNTLTSLPMLRVVTRGQMHVQGHLMMRLHRSNALRSIVHRSNGVKMTFFGFLSSVMYFLPHPRWGEIGWGKFWDFGYFSKFLPHRKINHGVKNFQISSKFWTQNYSYH